MKGLMEDFLLFIVGLFVIIILLVTVFGQGIAYNFLGFLADIEPTYFQEEVKNFLTVASYSPGDFEAKIKTQLKHDIIITNDNNLNIITVKTSSQFNFPQPSPAAFLTNCNILKKCTKLCSYIDDPCARQEDCCGILSCTPEGVCKSTTNCGNGQVDPGEECDASYNPPFPPLTTSVCPPWNCIVDQCKCPLGYNQCNDNVDNDNDGKCDVAGCGLLPADPECAVGISESLPLGYECNTTTDCGIYSCATRVKITKDSEAVIIRKTIENGLCKLEIM